MDSFIAQIALNLAAVQAKIDKAAHSVGRDPSEVRLLVVSKSQPEAVVRAAYQAGVRRLGENYPQEAEEKIEKLAGLPGIEWHMIGHLQSRKAPIIARCFQMIHSIDSLDLAKKLDRALSVEGKILPALLEVNVGGEESKFGWKARDEQDWETLFPDFEQVLALKNLSVRGLMTMPPWFENAEEARPFFRRLNSLMKTLAIQFPATPWKELSMGTSGDFEAAIQEGATMVRIGQAIMGPRPPHS
jgi:PLP dependent protein